MICEVTVWFDFKESWACAFYFLIPLCLIIYYNLFYQNLINFLIQFCDNLKQCQNHKIIYLNNENILKLNKNSY